jgi:hypothetical protein
LSIECSDRFTIARGEKGVGMKEQKDITSCDVGTQILAL